MESLHFVSLKSWSLTSSIALCTFYKMGYEINTIFRSIHGFGGYLINTIWFNFEVEVCES